MVITHCLHASTHACVAIMPDALGHRAIDNSIHELKFAYWDNMTAHIVYFCFAFFVLLFQLASSSALTDCTTSPSDGLLVKNWSHPQTSQSSSSFASRQGNVEVTGLSIGWHYFTCTVSGHCAAGMQLAVQVKSSPQSLPTAVATQEVWKTT